MSIVEFERDGVKKEGGVWGETQLSLGSLAPPPSQGSVSLGVKLAL